MTETALEQYFENLATQLKDIGHTADNPAYYRIKSKFDLDEFDYAVRNMAADQCLLLELGSGNLSNWDSQKEAAQIGLHVLVKTSEDFSDIKAAKDRAKAILIKLIARVRLDCKTAPDRPGNTIGPLRALGAYFDSAVKFEDMGDIDGNWYGKSFYFTLNASINTAYNANDWLDGNN